MTYSILERKRAGVVAANAPFVLTGAEIAGVVVIVTTASHRPVLPRPWHHSCARNSTDRVATPTSTPICPVDRETWGIPSGTGSPTSLCQKNGEQKSCQARIHLDVFLDGRKNKSANLKIR